MTTLIRHRPHPTLAPARAATALSALTLLAAAVRLVLPSGSGPPLLGIPAWCAVPAAALGLAASLPATRRALTARAVLVVSSGATVALVVIGADGIAFDLVGLLMAAVTAVTGTVGPVGLELDWAGFATRSLALGSAALIGASAMRLRRQLRGPRSGSPTLDRWASAGRWASYAAAVLALGYGALKAAWGLGSTVGLVDPELFGEVSFWSPGLGDTAVLAAIGVALALSLTATGGGRLTRWLRIAGALLGSAMLVPVGLLGTYGTLAGSAAALDGELERWVSFGIYPWFLAWGLTLGVSAWSYHHRTRPHRSDSSA